MSDVRLIDANALLEFARNHVGGMIGCNDIARFPTIDAVPVVRCRECWKRGNDLYCPMCHKEYFYDEDDGGDWELFDDTEDDGFCHRGKKKDGGAE